MLDRLVYADELKDFDIRGLNALQTEIGGVIDSLYVQIENEGKPDPDWLARAKHKVVLCKRFAAAVRSEKLLQIAEMNAELKGKPSVNSKFSKHRRQVWHFRELLGKRYGKGAIQEIWLKAIEAFEKEEQENSPEEEVGVSTHL